jgi:hypothetical protein
MRIEKRVNPPNYFSVETHSIFVSRETTQGRRNEICYL